MPKSCCVYSANACCIPLHPLLPQLNYSTVINDLINLVRRGATLDFEWGAIDLWDCTEYEELMALSGLIVRLQLVFFRPSYFNTQHKLAPKVRPTYQTGAWSRRALLQRNTSTSCHESAHGLWHKQRPVWGSDSVDWRSRMTPPAWS